MFTNRTAREVQRLDAVLQSPALSLVTESLKAPASARAYQAESFLVARHGQALDRLASAKICRQSLDTWITFRAELAAASVLLVLVLLTLNGVVPQVSASLALATATTLARHVYLLAWACTDLEIQLNAVERLQLYHDRIPSEGFESGSSYAERHDGGSLSSTDIEIRDGYLKYKTRKTPALDNISLTFRSGEKVGLIGRTGMYRRDPTQIRALTPRQAPENPPSYLSYHGWWIYKTVKYISLALTRVELSRESCVGWSLRCLKKRSSFKAPCEKI